MQAILTRYHGATNTKGSRLSASAAAGRIYMPYDHAHDGEANHKLAARVLMSKLGWTFGRGYTDIIGGCLPSGDYAWVFTPKQEQA